MPAAPPELRVVGIGTWIELIPMDMPEQGHSAASGRQVVPSAQGIGR